MRPQAEVVFYFSPRSWYRGENPSQYEEVLIMIRKDVEAVVRNSGLWNGDQEQSHAFVLSPAILEVSEEKAKELNSLARALRECLSGIGCLLKEPFVSEIVRASTPRSYDLVQCLHPWKVPVVCKVDMMEDMNGEWWIAEIDGVNKRGFGWALLERRVTQTLYSSARLPENLCAPLARAVSARGEKRFLLIAPSREMYYKPGFFIFAREMEKFGIEVIMASQRKALELVSKGIVHILLDWPIVDHDELESEIKNKYMKGEIDFLLPPKPFFGSKAMLAVLRNDHEDLELEKLLLANIPGDSLAIVRGFIPETRLVGKEEAILRGGQPVIKKVFASGMNGVWFEDDEKYVLALQRAYDHPYSHVIQRKVVPGMRSFPYFTSEGELKKDFFHIRVIVNFDLEGGRFTDLDITATKDRKVHATKDCLQFGAVLV